MIAPFAGASAPTGWLLCDGSAVSRTTYSALFAVTSTTYGVGDGSTTFNLPDLLGRTPMGAGSGTGLTARTLGTELGVESVTLTSAQSGSPSHDQVSQVLVVVDILLLVVSLLMLTVTRLSCAIQPYLTTMLLVVHQTQFLPCRETLQAVTLEITMEPLLITLVLLVVLRVYLLRHTVTILTLLQALLPMLRQHTPTFSLLL